MTCIFTGLTVLNLNSNVFLFENCLRKKHPNHSLLLKGERRNRHLLKKIGTVVWSYSPFISLSLLPFFPCDCPKFYSTHQCGPEIARLISKTQFVWNLSVPLLVPRCVINGRRKAPKGLWKHWIDICCCQSELRSVGHKRGRDLAWSCQTIVLISFVLK